MTQNNERMDILNKIESGEISPQEGARRLKELPGEDEKSTAKAATPRQSRMEILELIEKGEVSPEEAAERLKTAEAPSNPHDRAGQAHQATGISEADMEKWKRWWQLPMWLGIGVTILAGLWMNNAFQASGTGLWFYCSWLPLLAGMALIMIGGMSQNSRWLHVRINQKPGESPQRIALSFPLPLGISAWALRNFGSYIPSLDETALDEIILALGTETADHPLYIQVEDDDDGEQVEVYIG
ncbi:MAG: DUF2089 domain-containing protein [Anaerolineae bacterium]|nr:DUF2089 domain-containing protein [Anaerolineae bacterium]